MPREIEFRAFDKEEKIMIPSDAWYFSEEFEPFIHSVDAAQRSFEIMQYIGRKDSKGVKIFEDDICQYFKGEPLLVVWDQEELAFRLKKLTGYKGYLRFDCDIEVIGNRFENPELLEVKND